MTKYETAVEWIAREDEPEDDDIGSIESYITVALVADVFGRTDYAVAEAVLKSRQKRWASPAWQRILKSRGQA